MTLFDLNTAGGSRKNQPSMAELREQLRDRMEDLFRAEWGEPVRASDKEWRPRTDTARSMVMRGADKGAWKDHKAGPGGGPLEFFAIYHLGWDSFPHDRDGQRVLRTEVARWLGIDVSSPVSAAELEQRRVARAQADALRAVEAAAHAEAEDVRKAAVVAAVRAAARPVEGTPAEAYLRGRGVTQWPAGAAAYVGRLEPQEGLASPQRAALVVWARDDAGEVVGGQRILIMPDGSKAPEEVRKPSFGQIGGSPARFPARAGAPSDLIVAEGPETALAIWQAIGCEVWAVFGAGQFKTAPLPFGRRVILAPDQDAPDSPAAKAFADAVAAHSAVHPDLWIACAPEPEGSKGDLNDTLVRAGAEAVRDAIAAAVRVEIAAQALQSVAQPVRGRAGQFTGAGAIPAPPVPTPDFVSTDEASEAITSAVTRWAKAALQWDQDREGPAPVLALAASAGAGKSTTAREILSKLDLSGFSGDAIWHSPTLNLVTESAGHAGSLGGGSHVTRGRSAINPATGETMCARADAAEEVAKAGLAVFPTLCQREQPKRKNDKGELEAVEPILCPYFATCAHRRQWDALETAPTLRFETHPYITLSGDGSGRKVAARVIDETFWGQLIRKADLSREDWLQPRKPRNTGNQKQRTEAALISYDLPGVAREVWDALEDGRSPVLDDYTAEEMDAFAEAENPPHVLATNPDHPDDRIIAELKAQRGFDPKAGSRAAVWRVLADCKRRGLTTSERLRITTAPIDGTKGKESRAVLRVTWRIDPPQDVPLLILDADMTRPILDAMYPQAELVKVVLRPNAHVVQVCDQTFSKEALRSPEKRSEAAALVRVEVYRDKLDGERGVLAGACREVVRWMFEDAGHDFTGKDNDAVNTIMRSTPLHGARWLWFGPGSLGLNAYEDFGRYVQLGREELPLEVLQDEARALFGDTGEALQLIEEVDGANHPEVLVPYLMRDGSGLGVKVRLHPDERVRALQEQHRERNALQVAERLRLARATRTKHILIACKIPLPGLPVDELAHWEDIVPSRLVAAMAEAAQRGGILRLSATWLPVDAPETFNTVDAAAHWLKRGGRDALDQIKWGHTGNSNSITGTAPFNPVFFELRLQGQRGKVTPALAVLPGDVRAMVEAQIGPVAELRLAKPGDAQIGEHTLGKGEVASNVILFLRGGPIDLNLADTGSPPEAEHATADATEAGQKHPEDTGEDITARDARHPPADGANARVKGPITAQALPQPPTAAVIVTLPPRLDTDSAQPCCLNEDDDIACAPRMSIHGAEVVIFRRERPAERRSFDRLRGMTEMVEETGMPLKFVPIDIDAIEPAPQASALRLIRGALPGGAALLDRLKARLPRSIYAPEVERHWLPAARYAGVAG